MKFENVIKRLSRFGFLVDEKGHYYFWTRNEKYKNRVIQVINQAGRAIALPMIDNVVVHNGKYTIKNLVSFLEPEGGTK